eukprot:m.50444 g.50444  ORF g.50444 m.50444 type:complete len:93 (-) comp11162_c0_seq1:387-665(-)
MMIWMKLTLHQILRVESAVIELSTLFSFLAATFFAANVSNSCQIAPAPSVARITPQPIQSISNRSAIHEHCCNHVVFVAGVAFIPHFMVVER